MRSLINTKRISLSIYYLLGIIAASFPFGRGVTSPLLIALFILLLIYAMLNRKNVFQVSLAKRDIFLLMLPTGYYLLCILGLTYTSNMSEGIYELDKKITLIAFPVLFLLFQRELTAARLQNILKAFLGGIVLCGLISLVLGFYYSTSFVDGELVFRTAVNDKIYERGLPFFKQAIFGGNYFFGTYISPFIHTSYYGLYLSLGSAIAFHFFIRNNRRKIYLVISLLLFCILVLCDCRGPLISFLAGILLLLILNIRNKRVKLILPAFLAILIVVVSISPRTSLLFADLKRNINHADYNSTESTQLRIIVWESAIEAIKKHPAIGVGTGDREDAMLDVTRNKNKMAFEMKLNAHNQYLEAFLTFGIVGLTVCLVLILLPLRRALISRQNLLALFLMIMGFNMLFESMLQVFQGIVFFSFFYSVLFLSSKHDAFKPHKDLTPC